MIKEFDLWVHDNLMNPAFELVQKWFHWNRFQLIMAGIVGALVMEFVVSALCFAYPFIFASEQSYYVLGFAFMYLGFVKRALSTPVMPGLRACSEAYEQHKWPKPSTAMIARKARLMSVRHWLTAMAVGFSLICICMFIFIDSTILTSVCITIIFVIEACEAHLWGSDDVDPRDRDSIFEPDTARSSDSA